MKKKILIFAGTTEGRQLAEYAVKEEIPCIVSAATEYGEELLEHDLQLQKEKNKKSEFRVIHGRMDQQEMEIFFEKEQVGLFSFFWRQSRRNYRRFPLGLFK